MKVFPGYEFYCGGCGSVLNTVAGNRESAGQDAMRVTVKCWNKHCDFHGQSHVVEVPAMETTPKVEAA